jgi:hypothetical protein
MARAPNARVVHTGSRIGKTSPTRERGFWLLSSSLARRAGMACVRKSSVRRSMCGTAMNSHQAWEATWTKRWDVVSVSSGSRRRVIYKPEPYGKFSEARVRHHYSSLRPAWISAKQRDESRRCTAGSDFRRSLSESTTCVGACSLTTNRGRGIDGWFAFLASARGQYAIQ